MNPTTSRRGSTIGLVDDLLRKPPNPLRDELVRKAMAGVYHDYKSTLSTPKLALVEDLLRFGYRDLARKAARHEYDDDSDEADRLTFAKELRENPALAACWEELQGCKTEVEALAVCRKYMPISDAEAVLALLEINPAVGEPKR